ncbi:class I tRNA ligase family protein [Kitasatospora acidiphila]|uniref:Class I tRNA ligase family protein n=1 Tax=Kitasatospora acidiphila TaxID=2567942 RepID=A0A540VXC7_9ACTN|nr:class I tRNA ligase family protein [Kitasatospora acidiphila]TQF01418.1 class I tRNA ligase family protein [Kitasatospora acidiphila]
MTESDQRPRILIAATPTPNGDLHVGHMAGPYLAADVYARYLRATGLSVTATTATDDSQTYVVSTAQRKNTTPARLAADSTVAIERSLTAMGIEPTAPEGRVLPPIDARYREAVTEFVTALHEAGRLRTLTVRLPYAERAGRHLYDGLLTGTCPSCGAGSSGGTCEDCGHPNNFDELLDARYALDPEDPVSFREETILVLPMEEYRAELEAHFAEVLPRWRPHPAQLIRELLAGPLPVIPVTIPGSWGVPAPFAPTPGQIVYPWVEAMPASMYATWWANGEDQALPYDEYWKASNGAELVYFHGFDNVYHWGLVDLVLLLAHGDRYIRPSASVVNEFYELDHAKFSTSRNHLIRGAELVAGTPRDTARFYLALTLPERERTNFDRAGLAEVTARRLTGPWNELAARLASLTDAAGSAPQQVTAAGRADQERFATAMRGCFELTGFSVARAAELIADRIATLNERAAGQADLGDLLAAVRSLLGWAAPILVDTARLAAEAGVVLSLAPEPVDKIAPFRLPSLP